MHENLQNVCAVNQCGDVTLTVLQTLGDEYNINILLEVQFPDSVDIEYHMTPVYDSSVPMGQNNIYPADYALCYGSIDYADVKKLNLSDTTDIYESGLDLISFSGGSSFSICDYSAQNHTITYLLEYFAGDNVFSGEISLVISGFASYSGEQISGPCVITWDAENNGSVLEYDIYEDGKDVGDLLISAFAADIDVYTHQDPEAIICTLAFADGT